jgi:hypothetical protein
MALVIRIPVLVALLLASGSLQWEYAQQRFRLNAEGMVDGLGPWLALVALAIVFLVVAGMARDRRHPAGVLVVEGLIAVIVTFVPPLVWTQLVGAGTITQAMGGTTGAAYAQVLAIAWLVTVVRTARQQRSRN